MNYISTGVIRPMAQAMRRSIRTTIKALQVTALGGLVSCGNDSGGGGDDNSAQGALGGSFLVACDYPTGLNPAAPVHSCVDHYADDTSDAVRDGLAESCTQSGGTVIEEPCPDADKLGACLVQQDGTSDQFGLYSLQWMYPPTTTAELRDICESGNEPFVLPDGTLEDADPEDPEPTGPTADDLDDLCPENEVPGPNLPGASVVFTIETEHGTRRVAGRVTGTARDELEFRAQCIPTDQPGGYAVSFSIATRHDLAPGTFDKDTPSSDADAAESGEGEVKAVDGSYIYVNTAPLDRTGTDVTQYEEIWQGTTFSTSSPGATMDFEFEITSVAPLDETSTFFEVEAHGRARIAVMPTLQSGEPDPDRSPGVISVEF